MNTSVSRTSEASSLEVGQRFLALPPPSLGRAVLFSVHCMLHAAAGICSRCKGSQRCVQPLSRVTEYFWRDH